MTGVLAYSEFIPFATAGFIAFGIFSMPAAWVADKWSRTGMIAVFFGTGTATMLAAFAQTPMQMGCAVFSSVLWGLFIILLV